MLRKINLIRAPLFSFVKLTFIQFAHLIFTHPNAQLFSSNYLGLFVLILQFKNIGILYLEYSISIASPTIFLKKKKKHEHVSSGIRVPILFFTTP